MTPRRQVIGVDLQNMKTALLGAEFVVSPLVWAVLREAHHAGGASSAALGGATSPSHWLDLLYPLALTAGDVFGLPQSLGIGVESVYQRFNVVGVDFGLHSCIE